jgi:DNA-directed RNA polymerase specialized sigma24 family protein
MSQPLSPEDALKRVANERSRYDPEAWSVLSGYLHPLVFTTAYRRLGGRLDLAQEASEEAVRRLIRYAEVDSIRDLDDLRNYAFVVADNAARTLRRRTFERGSRRSGEGVKRVGSPAIEPADPRPPPSEQVDLQERSERLERFLADRFDPSTSELPAPRPSLTGDEPEARLAAFLDRFDEKLTKPVDRRLLRLLIHGYSTSEILEADLLGEFRLGADKLYDRIHRLREKIRRFLDEERARHR